MTNPTKETGLKFDVETKAAMVIERTMIERQALNHAITIHDDNKLYLMRFDHWYQFAKQRAAHREVQLRDCGAVVFTETCINTSEWDTIDFKDYISNIQNQILTEEGFNTTDLDLPILHH